MPADTALQIAARMLMRTATVRRDRQNREHAADDDEERIARRVRQAERVRRGDVLARVPHRGGRRERDEVEHQRRERHDEAPRGTTAGSPARGSLRSPLTIGDVCDSKRPAVQRGGNHEK